jgi:hypothetical protein
MTKLMSGKLKFEDGFIMGGSDPSDIGLIIDEHNYALKEMLLINAAHTGIQIRKSGARLSSVFITGIGCDSLQSWCGDWEIGLLLVDDQAEYKYSDRCHKDVVQMFTAGTIAGKYELSIKNPVTDVIIRRANIHVRGKDKGAFIVSEIGGITRSNFFSNGVRFDTDSNNPYFFSAERISQVSFGSRDYPISSSDISNKTFRIGNIKAKELPCTRWAIYCDHDGVSLELSESARDTLKIIKIDRWI